MGFFDKLFGSKVSVAGLQRAVEQKRFADARYLADELVRSSLSSEEAEVVARLGAVAGDSLARLNLIEARAKQGSGDQEQAIQHFDLALEHVSSPELKAEIEQARRDDLKALPPSAPQRVDGCASCRPAQPVQMTLGADPMVDDAARIDLILTSYPHSVRERYQEKSALFKEAFLLAHSGDDVQSLPLFRKVKQDEMDDLYWFELGALLARSRQLQEAQNALETALQLNPELLPALETLVEVLLETEQSSAAQNLVQQMAAREELSKPGYHALMVTIYARELNWQEAARHVQGALAGDFDNPGFIPLAASVLEQAGQLSAAESLLKRLPSGGCKGNMNLLLAEFYLRHQREPEKAFASFNAAVKQEPDNPRWKLRLAQACFARQWHKDGLTLLSLLLEDPTLRPELHREVQQLLAEHGVAGDNL